MLLRKSRTSTSTTSKQPGKQTVRIEHRSIARESFGKYIPGAGGVEAEVVL